MYKRAWRYASVLGGIEDAMSAGWEGFVQGLRHWDPSRGAFATCADIWVKAALQEAVIKKQRLDGVAPQDDMRGKWKKKRGWIPNSSGRGNVAATSIKLVSISMPVGEDGEAELLDFLADAAPNPEERLGARQEDDLIRDKLRAAMAQLDDRERYILSCRYLKDSDDARRHKPFHDHGERARSFADNLDSIATDLGVSRERIRQIEQRALAKLKVLLEGGTVTSISSALRAAGHAPPVPVKASKPLKVRPARIISATMLMRDAARIERDEEKAARLQARLIARAKRQAHKAAKPRYGSDEWRAAIGAANRKRWREKHPDWTPPPPKPKYGSPEWRAAISAGHKRKERTPEEIEAHRERCRKNWIKRRAKMQEHVDEKRAA